MLCWSQIAIVEYHLGSLKMRIYFLMIQEPGKCKISVTEVYVSLWGVPPSLFSYQNKMMVSYCGEMNPVRSGLSPLTPFNLNSLLIPTQAHWLWDFHTWIWEAQSSPGSFWCETERNREAMNSPKDKTGLEALTHKFNCGKIRPSC